MYSFLIISQYEEIFTKFLNTGTRYQFEKSKSGSVVKNLFIVYKIHLNSPGAISWPFSGPVPNHRP